MKKNEKGLKQVLNVLDILKETDLLHTEITVTLVKPSKTLFQFTPLTFSEIQ